MSYNIIEVIRTVLNFFFFYDKISQVQKSIKSTKKHQKAIKNTKKAPKGNKKHLSEKKELFYDKTLQALKSIKKHLSGKRNLFAYL